MKLNNWNMKNYQLYILGQPIIEGQVKAVNPIQALKQWYQYWNTQAGQFKNFVYYAKEVEMFENIGLPFKKSYL